MSLQSLEKSKEKVLTNNDRCDRCGVDSFGRGISQAYIKAILPSGLELLFCSHHGKESIAKLKEIGSEIIDESEFID